MSDFTRHGGLQEDGSRAGRSAQGRWPGRAYMLWWAAAWAATGCVLPSVANAQVPFIRIAKTGDPVPGMPGATWRSVGAPAIDEQGNIAIRNRMAGPGIGGLNDDAIFYGRPRNQTMIVRESELVPQFGDGVVQRSLSQPNMAQSGQIGYEAKLAGTGINTAIDDILWAGPPDSLQVVAREGEIPPGVGDGLVYVNPFGSAIGRAGHVAFRAGLGPPGHTGPSVETGLWSGTMNDPRLVVRSGDPAPGTKPGVRFPSSGVLVPSWTLNRRGAVAFPAFLEGPGVDGTNNAGIWAGTADDLDLVVRKGQAVPLPESDAQIVGGPGVGLINGNDRVLFTATVAGEGIDASNDSTLWAGNTAGLLELIVREGDEAPLLGPGYTLTGFSPFLQTEDDRVLITPMFTGPGVTPDNDQAILFGTPGDWEMLLRDGEQAPGLPEGVVLDLDLFSPDIAVTQTGAAGMLLGLAGDGVTSSNDEALFWRRSEFDPWQFVAREGEVFDGSVIREGGISLRATGGGEGIRPSINDQGELAFWVRFEGEFPNEVTGAYVVPDPGVGSLGLLNLVLLIGTRKRSAVDR